MDSNCPCKLQRILRYRTYCFLYARLRGLVKFVFDAFPFYPLNFLSGTIVKTYFYTVICKAVNGRQCSIGPPVERIISCKHYLGANTEIQFVLCCVLALSGIPGMFGFIDHQVSIQFCKPLFIYELGRLLGACQRYFEFLTSFSRDNYPAVDTQHIPIRDSARPYMFQEFDKYRI